GRTVAPGAVRERVGAGAGAIVSRAERRSRRAGVVIECGPACLRALRSPTVARGSVDLPAERHSIASESWIRNFMYSRLYAARRLIPDFDCRSNEFAWPLIRSP